MWVYLFWKNNVRTADFDKFLQEDEVRVQTLKCTFITRAFIYFYRVQLSWFDTGSTN